MFTNSVHSPLPTRARTHSRTHSHTYPFPQFAGESHNSGPTVFLCKSPNGPQSVSVPAARPVRHVSVPSVTAAMRPRGAGILMGWELGYIDLRNFMTVTDTVIDTHVLGDKRTSRGLSTCYKLQLLLLWFSHIFFLNPLKLRAIWVKVRTNTVCRGNEGNFSFDKFKHDLKYSNIFTFNDAPPQSENKQFLPHRADSLSHVVSKVISQ